MKTPDDILDEICALCDEPVICYSFNGDKIQVVVKRDGKPIKITVEPAKTESMGGMSLKTIEEIIEMKKTRPRWNLN